ncbi:MAG: F0F1 ATP synthase subunit gamma, partial [Syntrophales bacterium]|nr:F0F1 ATP synthase subunit gamma [Syntrophales bacterium]
MQTTESLKRKIKSAQDLQSVVKTMKALAAVSIRQYQRAVESLIDYSKTVEMGLQAAMKDSAGTAGAAPAAATPRIGAIIFGSDQGLCGPLNENIAIHALDEMSALGVATENRFLITIGLRVNGRLEDAGQSIIEGLTMPNSVAGITPMVQDLILVLEDWHFRQQIDHIYLYYNEYMSGANYRAHTLQLLPVDQQWLRKLKQKKWPSRILPTYTMAWGALFMALIREYLFVSLYRAFAESLASENASRLASMQNAEKNIEERLQELNGQFHRQRQMTITEELLDIVAGFEAMKE